MWRQGLPQWTEARLVPEFAQIFGVKVVEKQWRHCTLPLPHASACRCCHDGNHRFVVFQCVRAASLLGSPFFYMLLPLSWMSIRSAVTARRMLRAGNIEAAMKTRRPHRASHHAQRSGRHCSFSVPRRGGDILVGHLNCLFGRSILIQEL